LRPCGHAVDVARVRRRRQRVDLVPRPRRGFRDQAVDGERPRRGVDARRHLGGEHRPAIAGVVLPGRKPRIAFCPTAAAEASREPAHGDLLVLSVWVERYSLTWRTALEPSPTADATRFIDPARTSPTAKTPGTDVSNGSGSRPPNSGPCAMWSGRERSVTTNPDRSSRTQP